MRILLTRWCMLIALLLFPLSALAAGSGRIDGTVLGANGVGLAAVRVSLEALGRTTITDEHGRFVLRRVAPGSYSLTLSLGANTKSTEMITVSDDTTTKVEQVVDWQDLPRYELTVLAASRRIERVMEAPAAVSVITTAQIEEQAAFGLIPRLLEFTPGVEAVQAGSGWFLLNSRGFNASLNRRLLIRLDGRDLSTPFMRIPEWGAQIFPLDDLAAVELVRGPGSAMYGADAFNGVLDMRSRAPRHNQGGVARISAGEWNSQRVELRHNARLGNHWYLKVVAARVGNDEFSLSRTDSVEYSHPCPLTGWERDCLPLEAVPLPRRDGEGTGGMVRVDRYFAEDSLLTLEAGASRFEAGSAFFTSSGRYQVIDDERSWARIAFRNDHWSALGVFDQGNMSNLALTAGTVGYVDTERIHLELQGNTQFAGSRGFLVGGASYRRERIDTAGPNGIQTLIAAAATEDFSALFGQLEYALSDSLRAVVAARWDESSLHDSRLSPRASLLYAITPDRHLRLSYSNAFMSPNRGERSLVVPVAVPVDLSGFEAMCAPYGVSCGFGAPVRVMAYGNEHIDVEQVRSLELGFRSRLGRSAFLTVELYRSEISDFLTDLVSMVNPTRGWINPDFGPYSPPAGLPPDASAALLGALQAVLPPESFALLSNESDGTPVFAALSYLNFGEVDTHGIEVSLQFQPAARWGVDLNYTFFDYDVRQQLVGNPILPNAPNNTYGIGVDYRGERFSAGLKFRHVQGFDWKSGAYWGPVPAHDQVAATLSYEISPDWKAGIYVDNLLDDRHYEQFGGDLLHRRAIVSLTRAWRSP